MAAESGSVARRALKAAQHHVEDADFDFDMSVTADDALEDRRAATEIVDAVEHHLRVTKFLPIE